MDHPNIAKVLRRRRRPTAGRPYFVMELVNGVPITDYCDQQPPHVRGSGWNCSSTSATPSSTPIKKASSTATSSRRTCWSRRTTASRSSKSSTSAWPRRSASSSPNRRCYTQFAPDDRHAALHEPRASRAERPRHRHPQRHLFARRPALRAADRHDAVRPEATRKAAASTKCRRIIREEEPPKPSTRLSTLRRSSCHRSAAQRQHRAAQAVASCSAASSTGS